MAENRTDSGGWLDEETKRNLISRLKRIEGQARGIQKMLEEDRSCEEVVLQLAALKNATIQVGMNILGKHMAVCVETETARGNTPEEAVRKFMSVFTKFS
ncbi:MAG: metal-sensitive transcriptional regulator [Firmicutes bacterium]|nr:metal-sensitive transcriptional regulator [Bacillota bacterium]